MTRTGDPFAAGESCLLSDAKGRLHLLSLKPGTTYQFDRGTIAHDDLIGLAEGAMVRSSTGTPLVALRPRLADYVLSMKRGAAVLYPKDAGPVIVWGDIAPGCTVLEAGTGSGALTLALSRAVGPDGRVVSVERRDDHARHAARLIEAFAGETPSNIELVVGDVVDHVASVRPDRLVLDLPEPWAIVPEAAAHLPGGAGVVSYLPTVPQVQTLREAIDQARVFTAVETFEVMMRGWTIDGPSVRPDHRMVGHTGFITVARRRIPDRGPD